MYNSFILGILSFFKLFLKLWCYFFALTKYLCTIFYTLQLDYCMGAKTFGFWKSRNHSFALNTNCLFVYLVMKLLVSLDVQCGSSRTVAPIKAGFVARVGRRKD
jgi:hypothetical protein